MGLKSKNLTGASLIDADFSKADLHDVTFEEADLRYSDFSRSEISNTEFWCSKLQDANLKRTQIQESSFEDANLNNADLSHCDSQLSSYAGSHSKNTDLSHSKFIDDSFSFARLTNANLTGAIFTRCDFSSATFENAAIENTRFIECFWTDSPPKGIDWQSLGIRKKQVDEIDDPSNSKSNTNKSEFLPPELGEHEFVDYPEDDDTEDNSPFEEDSEDEFNQDEHEGQSTTDTPNNEDTSANENSFELCLKLEDWQEVAVNCWETATPHSRHGIFNVFTGAGKTVLAAASMSIIDRQHPNMRYAIIAPTIALAKQWVKDLPTLTTIKQDQIGMVGGSARDSFANHQVLVFVLASARKLHEGRSTLATHCEAHSVMLIVDECHRTAATASLKIYDAEVQYKLGLSATTDRTDLVEEDGMPMPIDQQPHVRQLGGIVYSMSLKDGIEKGLLPRFEVHHHAIELSPKERKNYEALTSATRDAKQKLSNSGGDPEKYQWHIQTGFPNKTVRKAAIELRTAFLNRKQFLYKASERLRVARLLVCRAWSEEEPPEGAILFNERITDDGDSSVDFEIDSAENEERFGTERLYEQMKECCRKDELPFNEACVAIEHSGLPKDEREKAVEGLRNGRVQILCTVKALQEGINVPDVGMGISVASTASARQRIQTMGRILRAKRNDKRERIPVNESPVKRLHLIYVRDSADVEIYRKTDWNFGSDEDLNRWHDWPYLAESAIEGEPLVSSEKTEREAWDEIRNLEMPQIWNGPKVGRKATYRQGSVALQSDHDQMVENSAEIIDVLESVASSRKDIFRDHRGKITITPDLEVLLKYGESPDPSSKGTYWALGRVNAGTLTGGETPKPHINDDISQNAVKKKKDKDGKKKLKTKPSALETDPPSNADYWPALIQKAFLGAAWKHNTTIRDARELLKGRKQRQAQKAAIDACNILLGESDEDSFEEQSPPPNQVHLVLPYIASAHIHGKRKCIKKARRSWKKEKGDTVAHKDKATLRCMELLLKKTGKIIRDPSN